MGWNWQLHACLWQYVKNTEIHIKQSSQDFIDLKQKFQIVIYLLQDCNLSATY